MTERGRWLRGEVQRWHQQGKVDDAFVAFIEGEYDDEPEPWIQRILYAVGAVVLFLAIFFTFAQFWDTLAAAQKLVLLGAIGVLLYAMGVVAEVTRRVPALAAIALTVAPAVLFFSFVYLDDPINRVDRDRLVPGEIAAIGLGFALALGTLGYGYWRRAPLAPVGSGLLYWAFLLFPMLTDLNDLQDDVLITALFSTALLHAAANAGLWNWAAKRVGPEGMGAAGHRISWAGLVNGILLIPTVIIFVEEVVNPRSDWTSILSFGAYGLAMGVTGVVTRYRELVLVGAAVIVADSIWMGASQGDVVGTILALLLVAGALIGLAQSGLVKKWLRPPGAPPDPPGTARDAPVTIK